MRDIKRIVEFFSGFSALPDRTPMLDEEMCQNLEDLARYKKNILYRVTMKSFSSVSLQLLL
jgi:hypothetical protein